ncbi:MAG: hypothetical protein ACRDEA_02645 [Microcystaceae cyanobacterium]
MSNKRTTEKNSHNAERRPNGMATERTTILRGFFLKFSVLYSPTNGGAELREEKY